MDAAVRLDAHWRVNMGCIAGEETSPVGSCSASRVFHPRSTRASSRSRGRKVMSETRGGGVLGGGGGGWRGGGGGLESGAMPESETGRRFSCGVGTSTTTISVRDAISSCTIVHAPGPSFTIVTIGRTGGELARRLPASIVWRGRLPGKRGRHTAHRGCSIESQQEDGLCLRRVPALVLRSRPQSLLRQECGEREIGVELPRSLTAC